MGWRVRGGAVIILGERMAEDSWEEMGDGHGLEPEKEIDGWGMRMRIGIGMDGYIR